MKLDLEQLKNLVESGDKTTLESYIYKSLEKEDVALVQSINSDVRSVIDAEKDKHHNKALETWKSNNLEILIESEVKKRNPDKTPEQIELEKLRKEIEDERHARNHEKLMNEAIKQATEKALPVDVLDFFIGSDEATTMTNLSKLEEAFSKAVLSQVDSKFKDNGRNIEKPGSGSSTSTNMSELAAQANLRNK